LPDTETFETVLQGDHGTGWDIGPAIFKSGGDSPPVMAHLSNFDLGALLRDEVTDNDTFWTDNGTVQQSETVKQGNRSMFVDKDIPEYLSKTGTTDDFGIGTSGAFTLCFWVMPLDLAGIVTANTIWTKGATTTDDAGYNIRIEADSIIDIRIGTGADSDIWEDFTHGTVLTVDQWYYVCWAHNVAAKTNLLHIWDDTGSATLGTDMTTSNTNPMTGHVKTGDIGLGSNISEVAPSDILLDKFSIYDRVMTVAEMDQTRTEDWDSATLDNSTAPAVTYSTVGDTVTITVTTSVEAFVENGVPYGTLETGIVDAIAYYTGKTSTTQTYVATLTAGMRSTDLVWKDANITLPSGCTMTNAADDDFTLTLPDSGAITNTTVLAVPGTFTIGTGGDVPLWSDGSTGFHDLSYDIDNDTFWIMPGGFTDGVIISADSVVMRGYGRCSHITGTGEITGADGYIGCVLFSTSFTDTGGTSTYHPICQRGPSRMGMNPR